jgi:hypothetical protein
MDVAEIGATTTSAAPSSSRWIETEYTNPSGRTKAARSANPPDRTIAYRAREIGAYSHVSPDSLSSAQADKYS